MMTCQMLGTSTPHVKQSLVTMIRMVPDQNLFIAHKQPSSERSE